MWKAVFWMLSDKGTERILQLGYDHVHVEAHPVQFRGAGKKLNFLIFSFPVMKVSCLLWPTVPLLLVLGILTRGKFPKRRKIRTQLWPQSSEE